MHLYATIAGMERVLCTTLHSPMCAFSFCRTGLVFPHGLAVFAFDDWSTFSAVSATFHGDWAWAYCSTLGGHTLRYTPSDGFETFPFPDATTGLDDIGGRYYTHRQSIMLARQEGLTKTYNRFHNPDEHAEDIATLRRLHVEMDHAVAAAYSWADLALDHGFHQTKQGRRYTISELARREVLGRLLSLNHARYAEEVLQGLHDKGAKKAGKAASNGAAKGKRAKVAVVQPALFGD